MSFFHRRHARQHARPGAGSSLADVHRRSRELARARAADQARRENPRLFAG